jgi:hypothetical protein
VLSESRCVLRLRYVDLVVSIEVAVEVFPAAFISAQRLSERRSAGSANKIKRFQDCKNDRKYHIKKFCKCAATFRPHCVKK